MELNISFNGRYLYYQQSYPLEQLYQLYKLEIKAISANLLLLVKGGGDLKNKAKKGGKNETKHKEQVNA